MPLFSRAVCSPHTEEMEVLPAGDVVDGRRESASGEARGTGDMVSSVCHLLLDLILKMDPCAMSVNINSELCSVVG